MIRRFHINNFKSLDDFNFPPEGQELGPFTCLIGLNGSGKSTLLQSLDFVAHLYRGDVAAWLEGRDWKKTDLANYTAPRRQLIEFSISLQLPGDSMVVWEASYNINMMRCTSERITCNGELILKLSGSTLSLTDKQSRHSVRYERTSFKFEGSILSMVKLEGEHPAFPKLTEFLGNMKSLELLSPHLMRKRAKKATDIGVGGERLSAFLDSLNLDEKIAFVDQVKTFYPEFKNLHIQTLRAGWKNLRVWEDYKTQTGVDATHLNDGLLRILAIVAQGHSEHAFLLFDEIENGMNPEIVERVVDFLIRLGTSQKQVVVTTHSPLILNFIPDEVALDAVLLLYKDVNGRTRCQRFFDIPNMRERLAALGPGEVLVDTNLTDLVHELAKEAES